MTSPSSMHEPGRSKPVNWANPEGGMGRQVGGGLGQGDTCTPVADPNGQHIYEKDCYIVKLSHFPLSEENIVRNGFLKRTHNVIRLAMK